MSLKYLKSLCLIGWFIFSCVTISVAQNLYNAYEIARELGRYVRNPKEFAVEQKRPLLGAVNAYLDKYSGYGVPVEYSQLKKAYDLLYNDLYPLAPFYTKEEIRSIIPPCAPDSTREHLIRLHNEYRQYTGQLEESKRQQDEFMQGRHQGSDIQEAEELVALDRLESAQDTLKWSIDTTTNTILTILGDMAIQVILPSHWDSEGLLLPTEKRVASKTIALTLTDSDVSIVEGDERGIDTVLTEFVIGNLAAQRTLKTRSVAFKISKLIEDYSSCIEATKTAVDALVNQSLSPLCRDSLLKSLHGLSGSQDLLRLQMRQDELVRYTIQAQTNYQTIIHEAEASQASGFRMPSQSEMIDALAIYLASRIKQEAAIWFFETFTREATGQSLFKAFFPATVQLLQSRESYEIPNLGAQWRYALSKDFIMMPRNAFESELTKKWPDKDKYEHYFLGAFDLADQIIKQNSYRETIKNLYLSYASSRESDLSNFDFNDFIRFLYVVNTEMFYQDSRGEFRMLTYDHYRNLDTKELHYFFGLLDIKHFGVFSKFSPKLFSHEIDSDAIRLARFFGKMEMSISHIDRVRLDFVERQRSMGPNGGKDYFFEANTIWNSISQLFALFVDEDSLFCQGLGNATLFQTAFNYMKEVFEVYNLISKRNFSGAIANSLNLLDSVLYAGADGRLAVPQSETNNMSSSILFGILERSKGKAPRQCNSSEIADVKKEGLTKSLFSLLGNSESIIIPEAGMSVVKALRSHFPNHKITIENQDKAETLFFLIEGNFLFVTKDKSHDFITYKFVLFDGTLHFAKPSPMAALVFANERESIQFIRKFSGFLNDVALATSDKQLARVVESYAMPPTSYKRKRSNWYSIDLTAIPGPYIGLEQLVSSRSYGQPVYGFTAPIGISFSKTFGKKRDLQDPVDDSEILNPNNLKLGRKHIRRKTGFNTMLTLSVVDIGAPVSYRLTNTGDELPHELQWHQVFSPGMHVSVAIPKTPLIASAGWQYTPKLRKINSQPEIQQNSRRFHLALLFDLPLVNLWEKKGVRHIPKEKK